MTDIDIDELRPEDKDAVHALYGRVFGEQVLQDYLRRWTWQFEENPLRAPEGPEIRIARKDREVVGHYATIPVRLHLGDRSLPADWGMDVVVDPRYQRQGIGSALFRYWHEHSNISMGLGLTAASHKFLVRLGWMDVGPVPCYVKILSGRGLLAGRVPRALGRITAALAHPFVTALNSLNSLKWGARTATGLTVHAIERFDADADELSDAIARKFDLVVERQAAYLNWRFVAPPHVRYNVLAVRRGGRLAGYLAYRIARQNGLTIGLLVDWLTDPDDAPAFKALLRAATTQCRAAGADKVRAFAMHAGFGRMLRQDLFVRVRSTMEFCLRFNDRRSPAAEHARPERWHITLGDSDQDR